MRIETRVDLAGDRGDGHHWAWLRALIFAAVVGVALYYAVQAFSQFDREVEPAQHVVLIDEILPPPDLPEPEPEYEESVEQVQEEPEPELPEDAPPPGESLGLDSAGDVGGDEFGLAARKGGRDLVGSDPGAGSGAAGFNWRIYAGTLEREFERLFNGRDELKRDTYEVLVALWLAEDGRVTRAELLRSTGSTSDDRLIEATLLDVKATPPPEGLPQPVRLRIRSTSRG